MGLFMVSGDEKPLESRGEQEEKEEEPSTEEDESGDPERGASKGGDPALLRSILSWRRWT